MTVKRAAIFLAAGQGKRMGPLTAHYPKCLLPVGEQTVLDMLLPWADNGEREVIVVTGHQADVVEAWIDAHYPDVEIRIVHNDDYAIDVNILSVEKAVNALRYPQQGYTIIETDLLLDPRAWQTIHQAESGFRSFWLTHGRYNPMLTGGIVKAINGTSEISAIDYVPQYNPAFNGWAKMVGMLSVGPDEVEADRKLRREALCHGYNQYYMVPWIQHRRQLPCIAVDISTYFARSFNSQAEYQLAVNDYQRLVQIREITENGNSFSGTCPTEAY